MFNPASGVCTGKAASHVRPSFRFPVRELFPRNRSAGGNWCQIRNHSQRWHRDESAAKNLEGQPREVLRAGNSTPNRHAFGVLTRRGESTGRLPAATANSCWKINRRSSMRFHRAAGCPGASRQSMLEAGSWIPDLSQVLNPLNRESASPPTCWAARGSPPRISRAAGRHAPDFSARPVNRIRPENLNSSLH